MPGHIGRQQAAGQFYQGVACADGGFAGRAFAAQKQPAEDGDVFPRLDFMAAVRAAGVGQNQVEGWCVGFCWQAEDFSGLSLPVVHEHFGQAVDDDVEEAAD